MKLKASMKVGIRIARFRDDDPPDDERVHRATLLTRTGAPLWWLVMLERDEKVVTVHESSFVWAKEVEL